VGTIVGSAVKFVGGTIPSAIGLLNTRNVNDLSGAMGPVPTALGTSVGALARMTTDPNAGVQGLKQAATKLFTQDLPSDPVGTVMSALFLHPGMRAAGDLSVPERAPMAVDAQRAQDTLTVGDNRGPSSTSTARRDARFGSTNSARPTALPPLVDRRANMTAPANAGAVFVGGHKAADAGSSRIATSAATRSAVPGTQGINNVSLTHADSLYNTRAFNGYDYSDGNNVKEPLPLKVDDVNSATPMMGKRQAGINRAWRLEVQLLQKFGRGTRPWTDDEISRILDGDTYTDLGYTGHHMNKVDHYEDLQGDPRNIFFLRQGGGEEHMSMGHPGGTRAAQPQMPLIDRQWMLDNLNPAQFGLPPNR
jgi:hypothetical protein